MATLIPAGIEIPSSGLEEGSIVNNDGHGFAIASKQHGIDVFGSMSFDRTMDALIEARRKHDLGSTVLFHSRFGTHGEMGPYNIHPFWVDRDHTTVMAHNGILPSVYHPKKGDRRSDTRIFVDRVTPLFCNTTKGVPSRRGGGALASIIGTGNKLVFLSVKSGVPQSRIINSHIGYHEGGVWYSNSGYKPSRYSYSKGWWAEDAKAYSGGLGSGSLFGDSDWKSSRSSRRDNTERCPLCLNDGVDRAIRICEKCDYCLDCEDFTDRGCVCFVSTSSRGKVEPSLEIIEIEDCGDHGYVKVDGVWRFASAMFDAKPQVTGSDAVAEVVAKAWREKQSGRTEEPSKALVKVT